MFLSLIFTRIFQSELRKASSLYSLISESYLNCSCSLGLVCSLCPLILSFISFFFISRISRSPLKTLSRQLLVMVAYMNIVFPLYNTDSPDSHTVFLPGQGHSSLHCKSTITSGINRFDSPFAAQIRSHTLGANRRPVGSVG